MEFMCGNLCPQEHKKYGSTTLRRIMSDSLIDLT